MSSSIKEEKVYSCTPCVELIGYVVTNFSFNTNMESLTDLSVDYSREHIKRQTDLKQNEIDPLICRLDMVLGIDEEVRSQYVYNWEITISGIFKSVISIEKQSEEEHNIMMISCSSILYSSAREYLRNATSAGIQGGILLPTVSFVESLPKIQQQKTEKRD